MELTERNQYLAEEWRTALTQDERTDFNTRARTTQIIPRAEQIKRTKKRMICEVNHLSKLKRCKQLLMVFRECQN